MLAQDVYPHRITSLFGVGCGPNEGMTSRVLKIEGFNTHLLRDGGFYISGQGVVKLDFGRFGAGAFSRRLEKQWIACEAFDGNNVGGRMAGRGNAELSPQ